MQAMLNARAEEGALDDEGESQSTLSKGNTRHIKRTLYPTMLQMQRAGSSLRFQTPTLNCPPVACRLGDGGSVFIVFAFCFRFRCYCVLLLSPNYYRF
jgi:hypothetical protein